MRCLIVDDHPLTRDGTAVALRANDADAEIHEAGSLAEALRQLEAVGNFEIVLLDLELCDSDGLSTVERVKEWLEAHDQSARIVVLSAHDAPELVRAALELGATGFILKSLSAAIFRQAVQLTLAGGVYIPEAALRGLASAPHAAPDAGTLDRGSLLTPRETEVAALLVQGHTYKRVARELERRAGKSVSEHTVRAHVGNIAWKLGVTTNAKAGVIAEIARRGLKLPRQ